MRLCLVLLFCLISSLAQAGAWPREKGTGFASVAVRLGWPQDMGDWQSTQPTDQYRTAYLEYGLTDRLTFGLDIGNSVSGDSKAIAFLQWPLRNKDRGAKVSFQLGLGQISGNRVVRPGLSVGWGLNKGWLSIDSVAEWRPDSGVADYKVDVTWGRNMAKDRKLILQLQSGAPAGRDMFARIAPSFVFPVRKKVKAEIGATYGLTGDQSMGLKLGLWADF